MFKFLYRRRMINAYWKVIKLNCIYGSGHCSASCDAKADLHYYAYRCGELDSEMVQKALNL